MIAQHEQQHDETMLATHQLRIGAPVLSAPPRRSRGLVGGEIVIPAGEFPWVRRPIRGRWTTNAQPIRCQVDGFAIDVAPVTNGQFLAFIDDGGYDRADLWWSAAWAHRQEAGLVAPQFWERDGGGWTRTAFGVRPRCGSISRSCTCAGSRPRPSPAGPESGCPPRPSGRRRRASIRKPERRGATRGARRNRTPAWPTSVSNTSNPPRSAPTRPARRHRRAPAHRRCLGMVALGFRGLPRLPAVPLPRVLRGLLRRRLPHPARRLLRYRRGRLPRHLPQLGPPDPPTDLRRFPLARDLREDER